MRTKIIILFLALSLIPCSSHAWSLKSIFGLGKDKKEEPAPAPVSLKKARFKMIHKPKTASQRKEFSVPIPTRTQRVNPEDYGLTKDGKVKGKTK